MLKASFKLFFLGMVIIALFIHHSFLNLFIRNRPRRLKALSESVSRYCRLTNKILGIKIDSDLKAAQTKRHLILSNHMSYLDILILSSLYPTLYVTSVEMKETLFLGQICSLCACIFTERRKGKRSAETMKKEIADIGQLLGFGFSMTIFPEGTSTNGMGLLPFKTTLIEAAVVTQKKVLPIAISYTDIDGKAFSKKNCDQVCWHGEMNFFTHMLRLMRRKEIKVKVRVSYSLSSLEYKDRNTLGRVGEKMIHSLYCQMREEFHQ